MMHRLLIPLALILGATNLFGQTEAQGPNQAQKPKPEGNCTVSGRVVSAADGSPLKSVRVRLVQADIDDHPQVYGDTTDNAGHFELKKVVAGRYRFFASHIGYLEQIYQAKSTERGQGAVLSLISGQEITDVLFRLVRAGVITGKVVDDTGEPMIGVNVTVLHKPSEEELEDAGPRAKKVEMTTASIGQTDDRGEYRIFGLKPGEYYLKATETGGVPYMGGGQDSGMGQERMVLQVLGSPFAPMYFPGVLQLDQAQAVVLRAGEEMQADFAMRRIKLVEVAGRVMGVDGAPESRAFVRLSAAGVQDWFTGLGVSTDSKGDFSIKGVPPGSYHITASTYERGTEHSTRRKIEVGESNIDSLVLSLSGGATIHGRVTGGNSRAPERAMVVLEPTAEEAETEQGFKEVEKDGSFELQGVPDGSYALEVYGFDRGWFVKSARLGNEDAFQKGVQVEDGAAKGNLEIVVSNEGGQLDGAVTDNEKNQPLVGAQIKLRVDPESDYNRGRSKQVNTDQNGHYWLKDLPPGKYKITAKVPSPGEGVPAIKSDPVPVTLGEREHQTVDIKLTVPKSE
jgi:protocatechuate 3,4-dioxygenase beta subunit